MAGRSDTALWERTSVGLTLLEPSLRTHSPDLSDFRQSRIDSVDQLYTGGALPNSTIPAVWFIRSSGEDLRTLAY